MTAWHQRLTQLSSSNCIWIDQEDLSVCCRRVLPQWTDHTFMCRIFIAPHEQHVVVVWWTNFLSRRPPVDCPDGGPTLGRRSPDHMHRLPGCLCVPDRCKFQNQFRAYLLYDAGEIPDQLELNVEIFFRWCFTALVVVFAQHLQKNAVRIEDGVYIFSTWPSAAPRESTTFWPCDDVNRGK